MVAYWDRDCRNVIANAAYVEWFGYRPDQMQGLHIREVLGEEVYAKNLPFIDAVLAGEEQLFERTLVDTSGRTRHTQASYVPDVVDGAVVGFYVLVTDVTPRVEAERALRHGNDQYRALARSMPGAFVLVFDRDLRFVIADGPALAAFDLRGAEVEGRLLAEVLPDRADELEPRYRDALAGRSTTWDRVVGGRVFSLTAAPVLDEGGAVSAGMVVGTDVTAERRRAATDRALRDIAAAVADGDAPLDILHLVTRTLIDLFHADHAGVARFDPNGTPKVLVALPPGSALDDRPDILGTDDTSASALVAATGRPQLLHYDERTTGAAAELHRAGIRTAVAAPINVNGRFWGTIGVGLHHVGDASTERELLDRVAELADIVALSISSAEAWQTLTELATIDPLTHLLNRRAFDEHVADHVRSGQPLSIAVLDLDHFKVINDTDGHPTGDLVLAEVARRLTGAKRSHDTVARLGGEEFAVLLADTDAAGAEIAVEQLRAAVASSPIAGRTITASAGIASAAGTVDDPLDADDLLRRADLALYAAKRDGRNCSRTAPPPSG